MAIMRECISRTRAPRPRAGIVVATSELATREQERYKTLWRHQVLNDRHAGHGVARYQCRAAIIIWHVPELYDHNGNSDISAPVKRSALSISMGTQEHDA